jgi:NhaP-type Na+/H+ or K+/H+ antiporter
MSHGMTVVHLLIVCLVAGMLGQILSAFTRLPSIIFLLGIGMVLGPDALEMIDPHTLGSGLEVLVRLGVALILFEGGLTLQLRHVAKVQRSVRMLMTVGVLVTFVGATAAAMFIGGLSPRHASVFGSLVTVTGPTVIKPIVRRIRLRPEVGAILEGEGILADPIGAIFAAICLEYALSPGSGLGHRIGEFALRIFLGGAVGAAIGFAAGYALRAQTRALERIKPLLVLACAFGAYSAAEFFRQDAGIMAAVSAGLAAQWGVRVENRELREFKELLTIGVLSVLFVLLAANLRFSRMAAEGWHGFLVVLVLMLVLRPFSVLLCTRGDNLSLRERLFIAWIGPRGIVAASVASLGALLLERAGDPAAHRAESLVFLTIVTTVLTQGLSAGPVAHALDIVVKESRNFIIVGGNRFGKLIGEAFMATGKRVTVVDRNPSLAEEALAAGMRAVCGDASDRETLAQAKLQDADVLIAVTGRSAVNQAAAMLALHDHDMAHVWIALEEVDRNRLDPELERAGAELLFGRPIPVDHWLHCLRSGTAVVAEIEIGKAGENELPLGLEPLQRQFIPVLVRRNGQLDVARSSTRILEGDRVTVVCLEADLDVVKAGTGAVSVRVLSGGTRPAAKAAV